MNITILGTGNIGGTLGKKWSAAGHPVVFGTRDPGSPKSAALAAAMPGASIQSVETAIRHGEAILIATPWAAVPEIASAHAAGLDGKLIFDATNNFGGPVINSLSALEQAAPRASIYRAFNSLGWEIFAAPIVNGAQADMFYSGPDGDTRAVAETLIAEIGVRPVWVGGNERIALVDNLGALWVNMVFRQGWKRRTALKTLSE